MTCWPLTALAWQSVFGTCEAVLLKSKVIANRTAVNWLFPAVKCKLHAVSSMIGATYWPRTALAWQSVFGTCEAVLVIVKQGHCKQNCRQLTFSCCNMLFHGNIETYNWNCSPQYGPDRWDDPAISILVICGDMCQRSESVEHYLLLGRFCKKSVTKKIRLDRVLSHSGQHCVDLSPMKIIILAGAQTL